MVRIPIALSLLGLKENGSLTCERSTKVLIYSTAWRAMSPYSKTLSFTASLSMSLWLSHSYRNPQPILLAAEGILPRRAESSSSPLGAAASCWFPHEFLLWRETKNASCAKPLPHSLFSPEVAELLEWCFPHPVWSTNSLLSFPSPVAAPFPWSPRPARRPRLSTPSTCSSHFSQSLCASLKTFFWSFFLVFQLFSLLVAKCVLAPSLPLCAWTQPASSWSC